MYHPDGKPFQSPQTLSYDVVETLSVCARVARARLTSTKTVRAVSEPGVPPSPPPIGPPGCAGGRAGPGVRGKPRPCQSAGGAPGVRRDGAMERPAGGGGARVSDGAPLVVVVGAGAAGLAAAATLRASRRARVIVLEARNRLGGRCMSVPTAGAEGMGGRSRAEAAVDLGAGWVHGAQDVRNPLAALVASRGGVHPLVPSKRSADARGGERRPLSALLISHDMDTHLLTDAATGAEFDVECVAAAAGVFEAVLEECAKVRARHPPGREWSFAGEAAAARERLEQAGDIPMLSYAERRVWSWFVGRAAGTWFAAETADPGAAHDPDTGDGGTDAGAPLRGTPAFVHGGLQALLRPLAAGVDIRFSNPVKRVCRHASGVTLLLESGGRIEADYCVCTIPLGVLKVAPGAGVTTLAQSYQNRNLMPINSEEMRPPPRFDPPLPDEHRAALVASRVAHENRVALRFARAFWPQEVTFLGACADSVEDCACARARAWLLSPSGSAWVSPRLVLAADTHAFVARRLILREPVAAAGR